MIVQVAGQTDWPGIISAFGPALTALALVVTAFGVVYNIYLTQRTKADVKVVHTLVNSEKTEGMQRQLITLYQNRVLLSNSPPSPERDQAVAVSEAKILELEQALAVRAEQQAAADRLAKGA